jgi:hypothetical protein
MRWERAHRPEMPGFTENDLKVCDLCGALNMASTRECVICGWHGKFDYDRESVRKAIGEIQSAKDGPESLLSGDVMLEEYLGIEGRRGNRVIRWIRRLLGMDIR